MRFMSSKFIFWSFLGWCYGLSSQFITDQNKFQRSFSSFQKSVSVLLILFILAYGFIIPFVSDYYFRRGVKERIVGRYENAVKFYFKSVKIWPKHIEAQYRLGYLYGSIGLSEQAVQAYLEVIKMAPFFASVHGNLGAVYSQMDNLEAAYQHLSIQERLNPYDADRLCSLASVLIRMEKIERAKTFLRRALLFDPNHAFALTALKQLRKLETQL
jgi:tetratricopeptide (TPR) repeat protein